MTDFTIYHSIYVNKQSICTKIASKSFRGKEKTPTLNVDRKNYHLETIGNSFQPKSVAFCKLSS